MIVKEKQYKMVMKEVKELVSEAEYGCDECQKVFGQKILEVAIFRSNDHEEDTYYDRHKQFCSWACTFKYLPKIKTDYFFNLPYVSFNEGDESGEEFMELIKKLQ